MWQSTLGSWKRTKTMIDGIEMSTYLNSVMEDEYIFKEEIGASTEAISS